MVRNKSRWLVGELCWSSAKRKGEPFNLNSFQEAIKETINICFGLRGDILFYFIKFIYFNKNKGIFIIQINRCYINELILVLNTIKSIEGRNINIFIIYIGGTINKSKENINFFINNEVYRQLKEVTDSIQQATDTT